MRWGGSGVNTARLTSSRVTIAVNEAIQAVCDDFPAIVKLDTVALESDILGASLSSDFNRLSSVFRLTGDTLFPLKVWEENNVDSFVNKLILTDFGHVLGDKESPAYCFAAGNRLYTLPRHTTDGVVGDTFVVWYYANDEELVSAADSAQVLPRYRLSIIYHAVGSLYAQLGQFDKSLTFMQMYGNTLMKRADVEGVPQ